MGAFGVMNSLREVGRARMPGSFPSKHPSTGSGDNKLRV